MEHSSNSRVAYYNRAQMQSYLVRPRHQITIAGRGQGKSTSIQAPRLKVWAKEMPRGMIGMIGASYMQLFTRILPGIIKGWREMGWIEERDFFVGHYAPRLSGIPKPFKTPLKAEYFIHTKYGSGISLFSQDKPGMSNGVDLVALAGDEAKFLNKARLDEEIIPAIRGEAHLFGHLSCYHGTLYTSDMPMHANGTWLLENKGSSPELIKMIENLQSNVYQIRKKLSAYSEGYQKKMLRAIAVQEQALNELRSRTTFIQYASSLQNLHVLGIDWLRHMLDTLQEHEFRSSILNQKIIRGKTCFYHALDENRHGYMPAPSKYVTHLGYDFEKLQNRDFRHDEEYDWNVPKFEIAVDSGGSFNCMLIGVMRGRTIRLINNLYLHHPGKIKHVVMMFKEYYQHAQHKYVRFHYDQTAIATRAESDYNVMEIVVNTLQSSEYGKWMVDTHYIRQTPSYQWRFDMIDALCNGEHPQYERLEFNRLNCDQWYESCIAADVKQVGNKLEKDKSSEKKDGSGRFKVSQEKATHLSEAGDLLISGIVLSETSLVTEL